MPAAAGIPIRCAPRIWRVEAGADGITAHLREDRRHISDADIARLKRELTPCRSISRWRRPTRCSPSRCAIVPHACCLVPEKREERTTEGGLDVARRREPPRTCRRRAEGRRHPRLALHRAGCRRRRSRQRDSAPTSSNCTPAPTASARSRTMPQALPRELQPHRRPPRAWPPARALRCTPATASPSTRWPPSPRMPQIVELNIGHFLIGEAIFVGLASAVAAHARPDGRGPHGRVPAGQHARSA